MSNTKFTKTIITALLLSLACGVFVSFTAIYLRPLQEKNKHTELQRNILEVAGLPATNESIEAIFNKYITVRLVDIKTGEFVPSKNAAQYDFRKALSTPGKYFKLTKKQDIALIHQIPNVMPIYIIKKDNEITRLIFPIFGKGLWSTLYGFLALDKSGQTIEGITFYEHGETPGLGGEITNPRWKNLWHKKQLFNEQGEPILTLSKIHVSADSPQAKYTIDSLSGATMTSRGVEHLVHFWMGENGYIPFLKKFIHQQTNATQAAATNETGE